MPKQPLDPDEVGRAPALSWAVLAREYAVLNAEYSSLEATRQAEQRTMQAIYASRSWRLLCWSRQAAQGLLPRGSLRFRLARACWRAVIAVLRIRWRRTTSTALASLNSPPLTLPLSARHVPARVRPEQDLRISYVGDLGRYEAASMRYRAHNLVEALTPPGVMATFVPEEDLAARLPSILTSDVIVLVRRRWNPGIKALVQAARDRGIPLVFDLDDFLLDPWVLPYIDSARGALSEWTLHYIKDFRATLESCDYFTAPTRFLIEQVAVWHKPGWVIRNGLNATQLELCRGLLQKPRPASTDGAVRIGYFSGTKTHQADFRVAYAALVRILQEFAQARLTVVGELDLHEFPGLEPFAAQIEQRPCVEWGELPSAIASVDINIVPLEVNPYTEAKSDLKYYEAAAVKIPTIASPTNVFATSIRHGETGCLAGSDREWYQTLKALVTDAALRRRLGAQAHAHALRDYIPSVIAAEALSVYRQILRTYHKRVGIAA